MPQSASGRPPTRRQLAAEQTRQKLLRAALDSFSERPYAEVTVGDIARSAGVAHGLLSHHFNGKDGLFAEAVREMDRQLRDATRVPAEGSAAERLRHHFAAHLRFLADHEHAAVNLVLRRAEATDVAWEAFESARREGRRTVCALLGLDAGTPSLALPLRGFTAACDEMALQWLREGRREDIDTLVGFFVTFLTGALRAAYEVTPTPALRDALAGLRDDAADVSLPGPDVR
ncbi:TetR/AcrR family transcriptional regulator [Streptomyces sp. B93]|uniref:TetR/AcrR family transcriptional regulator n=1 Tax=Streptomyces sp. B93 TaxID=2824875 RepID=UPI001B3782C6|nr:TetR family transcriptional regulator [Streptomyces sp. B93]MBQ1091924.1 TetR family transcriptional regulator [Streptomyces sp. B93]